MFNTSLFDDDKDLDTSQCGETFSELLRPSVDSLSLANIRLDVETDTIETQDNDTVMAGAQRPKNQGGKSTSWTEVVIEAHDEKDKFKERKSVASISTMTQCGSQTDDDFPPLAGAFSAMEEELGMEKKVETVSVDEELEKHEKESTSETKAKASSSSGVGSYRSGDKRMNRMVTAEEIRRSEKELVSNIVPASPPRLLSNNLNIGKMSAVFLTYQTNTDVLEHIFSYEYMTFIMLKIHGSLANFFTVLVVLIYRSMYIYVL